MTLDTMQKKLTYSRNASCLTYPSENPALSMVSGQPNIQAEHLGDVGMQGKKEDQEVDEEKENSIHMPAN